MAAVLWAAVDEGVSFLTCAVPREAGKSTTSNAALAMRSRDVPVTRTLGEPSHVEELRRAPRAGYLQIEEISPHQPHRYIWGEPVRRIFETLDAGYALQASLHAPSPEEAVRIVAVDNAVGDQLTSNVKLVLYIERFGEDEATYWRRLANLYELHGVQNGEAIGHPLFVWHADGDRFEQLSEPHQFGRDRGDLSRRAETMRNSVTRAV